MAKKTSSKKSEKHPHSFCSLRPLPERVLPPHIGPERAQVIQLLSAKWLNGTVLHYYFYNSPASWKGSETERNVVRKAFEKWKSIGIGLSFKEVDSASEAEIRIGFLQGDGSWSYIGRDCLQFGAAERTMNFGWRLAGSQQGLDTALHEIGHALGFPHEHQNPKAGIVWDEEAVYASLAAPPNEWSRDQTYQNIIRKIKADTVQGSNWDPNSVMHYPFEPGLILQPAQYHTSGLNPAGDLSARDKEWIKTFYPPQKPAATNELIPLKSVQMTLSPGQQRDFTINPTATRSYEMRTFGQSDTVVGLFEDVSGELRFKLGDDDSGEERNAYLKTKLYKGRKYVLRVRLYYATSTGATGIMLW